MNDEDLKKMIADEEQILESVLKSITEAYKKTSINRHKIGQRLEALRAEATRAKEADLPAIFDQMNTQRAIIQHKSEDDLPDYMSPYFAHMVLEEEGGRIKHVLLGHVTFLDTGGYPVINWRHAPISRIFFNYREGDEYEEELPGRVAIGIVLKRRLVTIRNGQLVFINDHGQSYYRDTSGTWQEKTHSLVPDLRGGAGAASRKQARGLDFSGGIGPDVLGLLDPYQFELLESDDKYPLLILGGAGCGKTTVALHRIGVLLHRDPGYYKESQIIVIVPEEGLVRLSRRLLHSLGLTDVQVATFDQWIVAFTKAYIRNLPKKIYESTPAKVSKFKRHPAMKQALKAFIDQQTAEFIHDIRKNFPKYGAIADYCDANRALPILQLVNECAGRHQKMASANEKRHVEFYARTKRRVLDLASDRIDIFSSKKILDLAVTASDGELTESDLNAVLEHSVAQFSESDTYKGVDTSRLKSLDGKTIDELTSDEVEGTVDIEDFALLNVLMAMKVGSASELGHPNYRYSHMVLDEAQELSECELNVIGYALKKRNSITIAGDSAQQTDPSSTFQSWEAVLKNLHQDEVAPNMLTTSYRSTKEIAMFAHKVLGPMAPSELPKTTKSGHPVSISHFDNEGHMMIALNDAVQNLLASEPQASLAVICKNEEIASRLFGRFRDVSGCRMVTDGDFSFRPGVDFTYTSQVKGLEFDYVIIPDASAGNYVDSLESRRTLHVAATRAIHQLWVMYVDSLSPILVDSQSNG